MSEASVCLRGSLCSSVAIRVLSSRIEILQQFLTYAADFEKTLHDDDWTRLEPFFADDAVYEVEAQSFGCRLSGRKAIFAGMKRSLDNFDRKFSRRRLDITSAPEVSGDEMRVGWKVTYQQADLPEYVIEGRTLARSAGDHIVYLAGAYDPSQDAYLVEYQRTNGVTLEPAYV